MAASTFLFARRCLDTAGAVEYLHQIPSQNCGKAMPWAAVVSNFAPAYSCQKTPGTYRLRLHLCAHISVLTAEPGPPRQ